MTTSIPTRHHGPSARVFVVTPVLNAAALVGDTVRSVVTQTAVHSGRVKLEYVVADGGSTDQTVAVAESVAQGLATVRTDKDNGLYDALASAWRAPREPGTVMAYLNAGDLWHPTALDVVLDVMESTGSPWVCGYRMVHNEQGQPTYVSLPFRYRRRLIGAGVYGTALPHIQQESTFWSTELMDTVDLDVLRRLRLAGDHYLWTCFAQQAEPTIVASLLGGFRMHRGQLSENDDAYTMEALSVSGRPNLATRVVTWIDGALWRAPDRVKKRLNPQHLLRYDHPSGRWH